MRVGSELKAARKKAKISVEVISQRTKINVSKLVALEKNDFNNLPTGLYLFSAIRAYAREVHIDPEPIVERLRAEFADTDALDALHALDATGALDAKKAREESNLLRNAAIAAVVMLMAAAGAGAGAYLHNMDRVAPEVRSTKVEVPPSSPAPATTVATAVEVQRAAPATQPAPAKTHRPKARTAAVVEQFESPIPPRIEEPADTPANIEEVTSEAPVLATAP
jgi:cytoskeleton protein RodZ